VVFFGVTGDFVGVGEVVDFLDVAEEGVSVVVFFEGLVDMGAVVVFFEGVEEGLFITFFGELIWVFFGEVAITFFVDSFTTFLVFSLTTALGLAGAFSEGFPTMTNPVKPL